MVILNRLLAVTMELDATKPAHIMPQVQVPSLLLGRGFLQPGFCFPFPAGKRLCIDLISCLWPAQSNGRNFFKRKNVLLAGQ